MAVEAAIAAEEKCIDAASVRRREHNQIIMAQGKGKSPNGRMTSRSCLLNTDRWPLEKCFYDQLILAGRKAIKMGRSPDYPAGRGPLFAALTANWLPVTIGGHLPAWRFTGAAYAGRCGQKTAID